MPRKVPEFGSREEEAAFWDKTGLEDLAPDEWEEVKIKRPDRPLSSTFAIRLDQETVEAIRRVAKERGLGATQLARAWLLERLRLERAAGSLATPMSDMPREMEMSVRSEVITQLMDLAPEIAGKALERLEKHYEADNEARARQDAEEQAPT